MPSTQLSSFRPPFLRHLGAALEVWMLPTPFNELAHPWLVKQRLLGVVEGLQFVVGEQGVYLGMALGANPKEIALVRLEVLVLVP